MLYYTTTTSTLALLQAVSVIALSEFVSRIFIINCCRDVPSIAQLATRKSEGQIVHIYSQALVGTMNQGRVRKSHRIRQTDNRWASDKTKPESELTA